MQLSHHATNSTPSSPAACAVDVLDSVPPVMWFVRCRMRSYRKGLSLPQFQTLVRVDHRPSTCMSSIAEHLGSSMSTTSRIVAGLVSKGLLTRSACSDDRRQFALVITARGRAVLDSAYQGALKDLESRLAGLSKTDRVDLIRAMNVLKGIFGSLGLHERIGARSDAEATLPPSVAKSSVKRPTRKG